MGLRRRVRLWPCARRVGHPPEASPGETVFLAARLFRSLHGTIDTQQPTSVLHRVLVVL